jgi:hypothetical protein
VWMNRSFTPQELSGVLKALVETLHPAYRFPTPPRKTD